MQPTEALRVGPLLLGILDGGDPALAVLEHGIALLTEHPVFGVAEEMAHRERSALEPFGHVALHGRPAIRPRNGLADGVANRLLGPGLLLAHGCISVGRTPPRAA